MTPLIENAWKLMREESKKYTEIDPRFICDESKYKYFKEKFKKLYGEVKKEYMLPSVKNLDRHKVASIIIISLLEADVVSYKDLESGSIFIGAELIALKTGLAYLVEKLNEKLNERGIKKKIGEFKLPNTQSCDTSYIEVVCRNLYYTRRDYKLNPLDLAERLFLLEYIALSKDEIDPDVLKDY